MSGWSVALWATELVLLAVLLVALQRDRAYRPMFLFFAWYVLVEGLRVGTLAQLEDGARPFAGLARLWFHVDQLLFLSVYFAFVWMCAELFAVRFGRWLAWGGWGLCCAVLVIGYPATGGDVAGHIYAFAGAVAVVAGWWLALLAIVRGDRVRPHFVHLAALILLGVDTVANLYGLVDFAALGLDAMAASWHSVVAVNVLGFSLCSVVCGIGIAKSRAR